MEKPRSTMRPVENSVLMLSVFSKLCNFFYFAQACLEKEYSHTML